MVGKYVIGMLSGGALVIGGFVLGSALFPLQPANDPAVPVAAATEAASVEPAPEPVPEPAPEPTAEPMPEPAPLPVEVEPEPQAEPAPAAEDQAAEAGDSTPAPETEATDADLAATPVAPANPDADADAGEADPAPAAQEAVASAETAPETTPESAPEPAPAAAEPPPVALPLTQLSTDAVLAALDQSAASAPPADAEPPMETAELAPSDAAPAAETAPEAAPEPAPEPAPVPTPEPEIAEAEPAPEIAEAEPAPDTPDAPALPEPPIADAMPAPALDDNATARLPGTAASDMPGIRPESLPDSAPAPEDADVAVLPAPDGGSGPTFKPAPGLGAGTDGVIVGRLPRIGDTPEAPPETADAEAMTAEDNRPIRQFAAAFENPDDKPVLAIVLIDPGTADLDRAGLAALQFPVSFALDPMDPATPERAALYRAAGKEVIMLATGIAEGAQASDVEVSFQSMAQGLPEAVAVMDLPAAIFQSKRPLASIVVPVVGAQGRGLLTWDQGLNAADQVARREDIAAAVVFRDLGSAGEDSASIRRVLDRAVFKAGQDGRVTVAGTASPATVAALLEWTVEGRAATVALAPLTAVMTVE